MGKNKVNLAKQNQPQSKGLILTTKDKKKLADFFSILIEIDRRENVTKTYDKQIN